MIIEIIETLYRNKGFAIVFIVYIIMFILDVITTLANYKVLYYLEANPLYPYIGMTGLIILNLIVIAIFYLAYNSTKSHPIVRYFLMYMLISIIMVRVYALQNNYHFIANPVTVEQAKIIATPAAKAETIKDIVWIAYSPMFSCIVVFLFWIKDHLVYKKG